MWHEFVQAKDSWLGGNLINVANGSSTLLLDLIYIDLSGDYVIFLGRDFSTGGYGHNLDIRLRGTNFIEFEIIGSGERWRLERPASVQSAANQESSATPETNAPIVNR